MCILHIEHLKTGPTLMLLLISCHSCCCEHCCQLLPWVDTACHTRVVLICCFDQQPLTAAVVIVHQPASKGATTADNNGSSSKELQTESATKSGLVCSHGSCTVTTLLVYREMHQPAIQQSLRLHMANIHCSQCSS